MNKRQRRIREERRRHGARRAATLFVGLAAAGLVAAALPALAADDAVRVADIRPGAEGSAPDLLTNVGGTLYFSAYDGTSGDELWKVTDKPRLTSPRRG